MSGEIIRNIDEINILLYNYAMLIIRRRISMIASLGTGTIVAGLALFGLFQMDGTIDRPTWRDRIIERFLTSREERNFIADENSQETDSYFGTDRVAITKNIAYGTDPEEKFDLYLPAGKNLTTDKLPVIIMVHGGGWKRGDKVLGSAIKNKVDYFLPRGYAFISTNYPMQKVNPEIEVNALGKAVAYIQTHGDRFGIDSVRLVLMGHSAGAHLVSLLTSDSSVREVTNVRPWLGTISLDSAAYDVVATMSKKHYRLYDAPFGTDRAFWEKMSPYYRYTKQSEPLYLVCSASRPDDACGMAEAFRERVVSLGGSAQVLSSSYNHGKINSEVGVPGAYTEAIQTFLTSLGLP